MSKLIGGLVDVGKTASKGSDLLKIGSNVAGASTKTVTKLPTGLLDDIAKTAMKTNITDAIKVGAKSGDDLGAAGIKAGAKNADEGAAAALKAGAKNADEGAAAALKAGAKNADEGAAGALKAGAKKADDVGEGALKAGAKQADDAAAKAAKEATELATKKTAKTLTKNLKKGALGLAALGILGLSAAAMVDVYNKSKESFDKRNEKQFKITKITSTATEMSITFENPEKLAIYAEEEVELLDVDVVIKGRYVVNKSDSETKITVAYTKPTPYKNNDVKVGTFKLFADQKNDVNKVIADELEKAGNALGAGLCFTLKTFGLDSYVSGGAMTIFVIILLILLGILFKVRGIVDMIFMHKAVPYITAVIVLSIVGGSGFLLYPYFNVKC